jgi:hypothetical protein
VTGRGAAVAMGVGVMVTTGTGEAVTTGNGATVAAGVAVGTVTCALLKVERSSRIETNSMHV